MRSKEYLLLEDGFDDSGSDWFYGSALLPSDAFDFPYAWPYPADFLFLQSRQKGERDIWGRKFHNYDLDSVLKTKFISIYSNTMPDTSDKPWKHRPDNRENVTIDRNAKVQLTGHGKTAKVSPQTLNVSNDLIDETPDLNKKFGKFKPFYYELPTNFDEPWNDQQGTTKMKYKKKKKYPKKQNNIG